MPAVRTVLRCLRPWHPVSGALFGYLFGLAWCFLLFASFDGWNAPPRHLPAALTLAIFWAVLWGLSGTMCWAFPGYGGTTATVLAIILGHAYALTFEPLNGWSAITIPISSGIAMIACHWLLVLVAAIRFRVE